jgi:glycosidase
MRRSALTATVLVLASSASFAACAADSDAPTGAGGNAAATTSTADTSSATATGAGGAGGAATSSGATTSTSSTGSGGGGDGLCPTTFRYKLPAWQSEPRIAGEWDGFDLAAAEPLGGPDADGLHTVTVSLPPGLHAYKVVAKEGGADVWLLDPGQGRRKYKDSVENSAIRVADCTLPSFQVLASSPARPSPGAGTYAAKLAYQDGILGSGPDTQGFTAELRHAGVTTPLGAAEVAVASDGGVEVSLSGLADGKYTVVLRGKTTTGEVGDPLRLVFWVEAEAFDWNDALVYMVMTDRYRNGDPSNDAPPTPNAAPLGDFMGGDLQGLTQAIQEGKLDALGVRAIWLTPFQTNPTGGYAASDGVHVVTGYHGYWPIKAREVDPRLGGEDALRDLVTTAHAHGIRILQDYVVNHVHEAHEYVAAHPDWFRTGCVCGTANCDWTSHALDCMFAQYMPDIDHTVPEANAQFVDDAVYWLDQFDLDGLRVDAVKHVEEVATRNLAASVRETFEPGGTRYFLMGETAMGWSDCADPCNDENYGTISKYVGPQGLDGQFDFVLYHGVSYRTFGWGGTSLTHADYWVSHGLSKWPEGAIMTPYIGSHDTARFATVADYRGQDAAHDMGIPGNQWSNVAVAPSDGEPYARTRLAFAWLLGLPGAPLLYYGDEYGQWGGADPNNRRFFRDGAELTADEAATLAFVKKLGTTRQTLPALRRGAYVSLYSDYDTLVFGRKVPPSGPSAVVLINRQTSPKAVSVDVGVPLGLVPLTQLTDALGSGVSATVSVGGKLSVTIPASSALVLSP